MNQAKRGLRIFMIIALAVLACAACKRKATTMQLVKADGQVNIMNEKGNKLAIIEQMGLYSGYNIGTQSESYAWINLDDTKLTKMDAESQVEIAKDKNKLEMIVHSGRLLFHVTQPLAKEESMEIRTSTMMVGIRGTCGWVDVLDENHMLVYLIEGTVECRIQKTGGDGEAKTATISGGEMADMMIEGGEAKITVASYGDEDIPDFVMEEASEDSETGAELTKIRMNFFMNKMEEALAAKDYDAAFNLVQSDEYGTLFYFTGENGTYYLVDRNETGQLDGIGIAAYPNGAFYYGPWINGVKSGQGVAFETVKNHDEYYQGEYEVYDGDWADGLPNGQGTSITKIVPGKLRENEGHNSRVSGEFADGLYNGRMEVETVWFNGKIDRKHGNAQNGIWDILGEEDSYLIYLINDETGETTTINEEGNHDQGVLWVKSAVKD